VTDIYGKWNLRGKGVGPGIKGYVACCSSLSEDWMERGEKSTNEYSKAVLKGGNNERGD